MGHSVAHIPMGRANFMGKHVHKDVLVYRSGYDPWCEDVALSHYADWGADMLITLKEPWVFNTIHKYAINFVPYAIIDHSPVSPEITSRLHTAFKVLVPSRFAQRELKTAGIKNVSYVPHGVRTDLYKPLEGHKEDCKKQWFLEPDDFTVLMVSMNRIRKMNPRAFRGYKRFLELNPDVKSHLLFWGDMRPRGGEATEGPIGLGISDNGINLLPEVIKLGLGEAIRWPDSKMIAQGVPEWAGDDYKGGWDMVKLYNAADVLLFCTGGEGFGLPLIESQACGVPVVTTDYAAAPEQVSDAGLTVKVDDYVIINTPGARRALTSIDGMAEALTKIMNSDREKLARKARKWAERYSWENVVDKYYKPFLEKSEEELKPLITKKGVRIW